jgi:hypothetical protein
MIDQSLNHRAFTKLTACVGAFLFALFGMQFAAPGQVEPNQRSQQALPSATESAAAWDRIVTVLQHPRCLNCHQDKAPLQGDMRRVHIPIVVRGRDGRGVDAMRCSGCHNEQENNDTSGVPGAGDSGMWRLAPVSMVWQGLSIGDLCRALKDLSRNGHRDGQKLIDHMDTEPLVRWAWRPGNGRTAAPLPQDEFVNQMRIWVAGGMTCPS